MTDPRKRNAHCHQGVGVDTKRQCGSYTRTGRREAHGTRPDRSHSQPAPTWPELPGERAMRLLERVWGSPKTRARRRR